MRVGVSKKHDEWKKFLFTSSGWSPPDLERLIAGDEIGAALFEIETFVQGVYSVTKKGLGRPDSEFRINWLVANSGGAYDALGPGERRDFHLGVLRWIKGASCLSPVLGAGATIAAGGPSWPALVRRLLVIALQKGTAKVNKARAQEIVAKIDSGSASVELLKEGVQLCHDAVGQHLYTDVTTILYEGDRRPSAIHRAIADLASPQVVADRGGKFPGWAEIVTYNFDDFMGQALDDVGLARTVWAMRGGSLAGDPNELAIQAGQSGLYQSIYHLHGYTPRRLFNLTEVRFVFAMSEYTATYEGRHIPIFVKVSERVLEQPVHVALYVGCSFDDESMNDLLEKAAKRFPGRAHYALMQWSGKGPYLGATAEELNRKEARLRRMGVRPVWFDKFDEIPHLIRAVGGTPGESFSYRAPRS